MNYPRAEDEKLQALLAFIGTRNDPAGAPETSETEAEEADSVECVRSLRRGDRLERLYKSGDETPDFLRLTGSS